MNTKFFNRIALMFAWGITVTACSQSDDVQEMVSENEKAPQTEEFVYTMHLDCQTPDYDQDGNSTRAGNTSWSNGSVVYLLFGNIAGTATYSTSTGTWSVTTNTSLSTTSTPTVCKAFHFKNAGNATTTAVTLNEYTECYGTESAIYTHPSSSDIYVTAVLEPLTWRLYFKGNSGTQISLPANGNDINYYNSFNRTTGNFSYATKDVSLTAVSNGNTPYIYGIFKNANGNNTITVRSDNTYSRTISASQLQAKAGGYLTIPTASNYQSLGWTSENVGVQNCKVYPEYPVAFSDSYVTNLAVEDNVATCYWLALTASQAESMSDDEIITYIKRYTTEHTAADAKNTLTCRINCEPLTSYYLCSIAYDAQGHDGGLVRTKFTTKSDQNQPVVTLTTPVVTTSGSTAKWSWSTNVSASTAKYYMLSSQDEDFYNDEDIWNIWAFYYYIQMGYLTSTYTETTTWTTNRTSDLFWICTWGMNASGELSGVYSTARATASSRKKGIHAKGDAILNYTDKNRLLEKFKSALRSN